MNCMGIVVGFFILQAVLCYVIFSAFTSFKSGDIVGGIFLSLVVVGIFKGGTSWLNSTSTETYREEEEIKRRAYQEQKEKEDRQRMIKAENEKNALLRTLGTGDVDTLSGEEFEHAVAHYLRNVGFEEVKTTPGSGDFGADLIIKHGGQKIVVQCKRWSATVGVNAVQEVHSAKSYYRASEAWVITSSSFSQPAKDLAQKTRVRLFDLDDVKSNRIQAW